MSEVEAELWAEKLIKLVQNEERRLSQQIQSQGGGAPPSGGGMGPRLPEWLM